MIFVFVFLHKNVWVMFFFIYLCPRLEREIDNQNRFNRDYSHLKCYILVWRLRKINYQKVIEKMKKLFLVAAFAMVSAFKVFFRNGLI